MAALALAGLLLACQSDSKSDYPMQYRAWCWSESKPLGDWTLDEAEAKKQVEEHRRLWPHHRPDVKRWRGDPKNTGAK
jgi:hypothetical protein